MSVGFKWIVGTSLVGILACSIFLMIPEPEDGYSGPPSDPFQRKIYEANKKLASVTLRPTAYVSKATKVANQSGKSPFSCHGVIPISGRPKLTMKPVFLGRRPLTDLAFAPNDSDRLFFLEQNHGNIRVLRHGKLMEQPFLNIRKQISNHGERGLLGLAFHPNYRLNRKFYIYFTGRKGEVRIVEYTTSANPEVADPKSARVLLVIPEPEGNHNGGALRFGQDGYLYIGVGDGGAGGDPHGPIGNGQNPGTFLGKILRIDVNKTEGKKPYAIPPDNPFRNKKGFLPEIVHWGLRNPWRISFDSATGDLWIGDVGQNRAEEINFAPKKVLGLNFGWRCKEGILDYANDKHCAKKKLVGPVLHLRQYKTGFPRYCSVMPGYHYRGCKMPGYRDTFFYTDYCINQVRAVRWDGTKPNDDKRVMKTPPLRITSWAEDHQGELYVASGRGHIYKIVPQ